MARLIRRLTAPIAFASALGLVPGCSLFLDGPRPERLVSERPVCDHSKGFVAADGVVGGILGIGAIGVADESSSAALVMGLLATAYVAAALHGNSVVDECRQASGTWERDYADRRLPNDMTDDDVASAPPARTPPVRERPPVIRTQPAVVVTPPPSMPPSAPPPSEQAAPSFAPPRPAAHEDAGEWSSFWEETP